MKKQLFIGFLSAFLSLSLFAKTDDLSANNSPIGNWITIDDATQKPRSVVQIYEENNMLMGKITKVYYRKGESSEDVCTKCTGDQQNQKFVGLLIIKNMQKTDEDTWSKGSILDPESGKIYKSKMTLSADGKTLNVRGYIGVSLLGRTQVWQRQ